ncbi:unnamed protein product [Amoebophrya sp. A120]|nr:unnamed protein product [Amoebophrya sp. A120]|eukprot:GSA120T00021111001.1
MFGRRSTTSRATASAMNSSGTGDGSREDAHVLRDERRLHGEDPQCGRQLHGHFPLPPQADSSEDLPCYATTSSRLSTKRTPLINRVDQNGHGQLHNFSFPSNITLTTTTSSSSDPNLMQGDALDAGGADHLLAQHGSSLLDDGDLLAREDLHCATTSRSSCTKDFDCTEEQVVKLAGSCRTSTSFMISSAAGSLRDYHGVVADDTAARPAHQIKHETASPSAPPPVISSNVEDVRTTTASAASVKTGPDHPAGSAAVTNGSKINRVLVVSAASDHANNSSSTTTRTLNTCSSKQQEETTTRAANRVEDASRTGNYATDMSETTRFALLRTDLANERTFLAWIRTAAGLVTLGFAMDKLNLVTESHVDNLCAIMFVLLGVFSAAYGTLRYYAVRNAIRERAGGTMFGSHFLSK